MQSVISKRFRVRRPVGLITALVFSPSGFVEFIMATAVPAPDNAVAPTKPPAVAVQTVHELAAGYEVLFG